MTPSWARRHNAVRFNSFFISIICVIRCLICITAQSSGEVVLPTPAFIHGFKRINLRRRTESAEHARCDLTSKSSDACYKKYDDDGEFFATGLHDRRSCLASISFGMGAVINADFVSAKEIGKNEGRDLLSTLTHTPKMNNMQLQSDETKDVPSITITLPLELASGGTFCVRLTVSAPAGGPTQRTKRNSEDSFRLYRAIIDTGSPYLVLPSSGPDSNKQGVFPWMKAAIASTPDMEKSALLSNSEYPPTEEIYGAVKGFINWKLARYEFRDPHLQIVSNGNGDSQFTSQSPIVPNAGVVGVLDDALTNEATGGGQIEPFALLGLIRNSNPSADRTRFPDPRPSFVEQERMSAYSDGDNILTNEQYPIRSFSINGPQRELTLSSESLIPSMTPAMPLVDLRTVGDFVDHYAVVVESVSFDGVTVTSRALKEFSASSIERPIVAVFDTGLTGCLLIRPFWDEVQKFAKAESNSAKEFQSVSLSIRGSKQQKGNASSPITRINSDISEDRRFYVQPIDLDWFDDEQYSPYVIVLGQTFLSQGALTIDMGKRLATFNQDVK